MTTAGKRLWLVLPDPLPTRVFLECGIAEGLRERLGDQLTVVPVLGAEELEPGPTGSPATASSGPTR